jgi:hypothetical protein
MSKAILPECEYCYLNTFWVSQQPASTAGNWEIAVSISCDLLDSDRNHIPTSNIADTYAVVSGTTTSGMLTLSEILSHMDAVETVVGEYMVWAKEEYAGYTG